jgi:hypothetical protein
MTTVKLAEKFLEYCKKNPSQRFWQALRNFVGAEFVGVSENGKEYRDTFYEDFSRRGDANES